MADLILVKDPLSASEAEQLRELADAMRRQSDVIVELRGAYRRAAAEKDAAFERLQEAEQEQRGLEFKLSGMILGHPE